MVYATFLLPVWPEIAVGGLFLPVMRVLRCVVTTHQQTVAECYGASADDRNTTSGSTGSEYSTSQITGSTLLSSRGFRIVELCESDDSRPICGLRQTGSGCLSTGSSFSRPEVAVCGPDTATPITPSVKEFSVSTPSPLLSSI